MLGATLTTLGGIAAAGGVVQATVGTDNDDKRVIAAGVAGAGLAAIALGVYFVTQGAQGRAMYWTANGALAQMRADRLSTPQYSPPAGTTGSRWVAETREKAGQAALKAASLAEKAARADRHVARLQEYDLKRTPSAAEPSDPTNAAIQNAEALHTAAADASKESALAAAEATKAASALAAEQLAWATCSRALTAMAGPDSSAGTNYVTTTNETAPTLMTLKATPKPAPTKE